MVAIKTAAVSRFVQSLPRQVVGALLYGSDTAQISAGTDAVMKSWRSAMKDAPPDVIKLYEHDLSAAPERITVELTTIPMFGGTRIVWLVSPPASTHAAIVEAANELRDALLLIQAPDLKKSSKLVQAFESAQHLAALACYGEETRDVLAAIKSDLAGQGYAIDGDALALLQEKVGNSQLAARAETEKLIAYAGDQRAITLGDVEATTEDQTEAGFDDVIGNTLDGRPGEALASFDRFLAAGNNATALLTLLQSRLMRLHGLRTAVDSGEPIAVAIKRLRPPVFFKQQDALMRQCRLLSAGLLADMIAEVADALRKGRTNPQLADQMAERAVLRIATGARRASSGGHGNASRH